MLDYTTTPEKVKDLYITPYRYRIELDLRVHNIDGIFSIVFDGQPRIVYSSVPVIEFFSLEKLTKEEVENKVKGTKGIKNIFGEFNIDGEYII